MSVMILHLSDIHIKSSGDVILSKHVDIAACTYSSLPEASHVFIVVSGDIAFSGKSEQYDLALLFLKKIKEHIVAERLLPVSFIIVPGNHDCDFDLDSGTRRLLVQSLISTSPPEIDSSIVETCVNIQQAFFSFRDALEDTPSCDDKLWRTHKFDVNGESLVFDCLNISWVSQLNEPQGSLYFPVNSYREVIDQSIHTRLVVLHHPLNWFNQTIYRSFRTFVRKAANIVISGHEHQGNSGVIQEVESGNSAYIEGCVLQESGKSLLSSSFNISNLDLGSSQFTTTRYTWNNSDYLANDEIGEHEFHHLPSQNSNPFIISDEFQKEIDDPGGYFKHPSGIDISLADIYVYPDMKKVGNSHERSVISSKRLLSSAFIEAGVIIEGEEKYGSTSLLLQLFRDYHDRGLVPLIVQGREIKSNTHLNVDALIKKNVIKQYGKNFLQEYAKLPSSQKVMLLDDFDEGPVKESNAKVDLLCAIRKRFSHLVITVSNMFEIKEMLDGDASRRLIPLEHFQLQKFGYVLRSKLIQRWISLGADGTMDEATFIAHCDQAERLLDSVMTKAFIPSVPLYLLTLLQSLEAGRSTSLKESSLGHYYHYLLTEGFESSGVKYKKLTASFQYASHLAWEFHLSNKRELSDLELRAFNAKFSDEWFTVDFSTKIKELVDARVLYRVGDDHAFRYPYIYYYLKGQYLSDKSTAVEVREHVEKCCQHLYVRDYASTILFLAHHTSDDTVLSSVSETLKNLFKSRAPITFENDTDALKGLLENAPALTYSGEKPQEHRARRNETKDLIDDGHDGLAEKEENSDREGLSLIAQITMLFKTSEILGQVLKDQYSKIKRTRKVELLEQLFNGPLRAISDFYSFIERNPDALVAEIESTIKRKGNVSSDEKRKAIAKKVVASLIQVVTFSFVLKGSQSVNSDSLLEDINEVVNQNSSIAFKIFEVGIYLDSPKNIPRSKLKEIIERAKGDLIISQLLQIMILNRLYMFKTSESDMQWISQELKINIAAQHSIAYKEHGRRVIK